MCLSYASKQACKGSGECLFVNAISYAWRCLDIAVMCVMNKQPTQHTQTSAVLRLELPHSLASGNYWRMLYYHASFPFRDAGKCRSVLSSCLCFYGKFTCLEQVFLLLHCFQTAATQCCCIPRCSGIQYWCFVCWYSLSPWLTTVLLNIAQFFTLNILSSKIKT